MGSAAEFTHHSPVSTSPGVFAICGTLRGGPRSLHVEFVVELELFFGEQALEEAVQVVHNDKVTLSILV